MVQGTIGHTHTHYTLLHWDSLTLFPVWIQILAVQYTSQPFFTWPYERISQSAQDIRETLQCHYPPLLSCLIKGLNFEAALLVLLNSVYHMTTGSRPQNIAILQSTLTQENTTLWPISNYSPSADKQQTGNIKNTSLPTLWSVRLK